MINVPSSILNWVIQVLTSWNKANGPILIGVNGPQGCGKSTLTRNLVHDLSAIEVKAVTISIDDFYLTRKEQIELAQQFFQNPLLQQRGYPGTHDINLGIQTLNDLKTLKNSDYYVPTYDKSKHNGRGDRLPKSEWRKVTGPLDVIFLEGWMLGFQSLPENQLPNENFKQINFFLKSYEAWNHRLDAFIQLVPQNLSWIQSWRIEAEEKMKATGKPGMSNDEIKHYISQFIPAYQTYLPTLQQTLPVSKNFLKVSLSKGRQATTTERKDNPS